MYYGVEQSTDMRCPCTKVLKFRTSETALRWRDQCIQRNTYDDPALAANYHQTFRRVYELEGRVGKKHNLFKDCGTMLYPRNSLDTTATYLFVYGKEVT